MKDILAPVSGRQAYPIRILKQWNSVVSASPIPKPTELSLKYFNKLVNETYTYAPESVDKWKTPFELEASGRGDCEDFAIFKFYHLDLPKYLAVGSYKSDNLPHAVCVVYSPEEKDWVVLDCKSNDIVLWKDFLNEFTPVYLCDRHGVYI